MKILVIGCGSIGRRHIRLLKEMGVEVTGFDVPERLDALRTEFPGAAFYGHAEPVPWLHLTMSTLFDGVIVATPNHLHARPAQAVLCCGRPVLIEKPITTTVHDAEALLKEARSPVFVGYCLRFHPGLRRVRELIREGAIGKARHASIHFGSYLPDWRPGFDYRKGYAAKRETGGGILLDASHELDYACWLFGNPVSVMAQVQNTGALEIETEDIADLLLRFESGVQVNVHLDYLDEVYNRGLRIIGDNGTITWDFTENIVHHYSVKMAARSQQFRDNGHTQYNENWCPHNDDGLASWVPDDMYRAQLEHFVRVIRGEEQPLVTGEDGIRAVRLVEAARQSSAEGRTITL